MKDLIIKITLFVIFSSLVGLVIYQQIQISRKQELIEQQISKQKELSDNITRSMSEFASKKDIDEFIKNNNVNLKVIEEDLNKLHASISSVNSIKIVSNGTKQDNLPSSTIGIKNPNQENIDKFGYLRNQQKLTLNENFNNISVPIGEVGFSAWQEKPWSIDLKSREYNIVNIIGTDENQKNYVYNKFFIKVDNKTYDIKISSSQTLQELPVPNFYFWNPRLFLGIDGGLNLNKVQGEVSPNLSIGIMSYGQFKKQPDLTVLNFGLGYGMVDKSPIFSLTPVSYNIGKHIPLMNNTYFGPSLSFNISKDILIMAGIKVGL